MPLYLCSSPKNLIAENRKPVIAKELTHIHCDVTGAPSSFVHVFFVTSDDASEGLVSLFGSIRGGRSDDQKTEITSRMSAAVARLADLDPASVSMGTVDVPAKWAMEGGDIMPEPGEEAAWFAAHAAKAAAS
jgi:phenylpyruvate tautomerase PptA (4-oxalocrotonate tautomerase family)